MYGPSLLVPLVGVNSSDLMRMEYGVGSLTFSRATIATRFNPDTALVEEVVSGFAREDGRYIHNHLMRSNEVGTVPWYNVGNTIQGSSTAAPDGTMTACKIICTNSAGSQGPYQYLFNNYMVYSKDYRVSFYAKYGGVKFIIPYAVTKAGSAAIGRFNVENISIGSEGSGVASYHIATNVGNGWGRYSFEYRYAPGSNFSNDFLYLWLSNTSGAIDMTGAVPGVDGVHVWGVQVEEVFYSGSGPSAPYKTTTAVAYSPKGVLIEGQRTNLCLQSGDQTISPWSTYMATASYGAHGYPSPMNGNTTMLWETSVTDAHYIIQTFAASATPGDIYTVSFYTMPMSGFGLHVRMLGTAGAHHSGAHFNLKTMATTKDIFNVWSCSDARISRYQTAAGYLWSKIEMTTVVQSNNALQLLISLTDTPGTVGWAGTSKSVLVWGVQLEKAAYASSYIPTTNAVVTRNADLLYGTSSLNFYPVAGSFFAIVDSEARAGYEFVLLNMNDGQADEIYFSANMFNVYDGVNAAWGPYITPRRMIGAGVKWGVGYCHFAVDGTVTKPAWAGTFEIGSRFVVGNYQPSNLTVPLAGHIKHLMAYSFPFTDSQISKITGGRS